MKKLKTIIFMLCMMIFFTGCDVEYNLVIDNNKQVSEEVILLEDNTNMLKYADNVDQFLYQRERENFTDTNYKLERIYLDNQSGLKIKNTYKSLDEYINSRIYNRLFETAYIENDSKFYSFNTAGQYYRNNVFSTPLESTYRYKIDKIIVNIQFYNIVDAHNADKVDETNNIYTWYLESDNLNEMIKFTLSDKVRNDLVFKKNWNNHKVLIISVISIIVILVFVIIKFKNIYKQNNKI